MKLYGSRLVLAVLAVAAGTATVSAAPMTALDFGAAPNFNNFYNDANYSIGWQFQVGPSGIVVTSLGLAQEQVAQGARDVGIWNEGATLLASTTIDVSTATLDGLFYYESIAPLALAPGTYRIAGVFLQDTGNYAYDTPFTTGPNITFVQAAYTSGSSLAFPSTLEDTSGYFGPNFQYDSVPEPATASLLLAGAALVFLGRIGRRGR